MKKDYKEKLNEHLLSKLISILLIVLKQPSFKVNSINKMESKFKKNKEAFVTLMKQPKNLKNQGIALHNQRDVLVYAMLMILLYIGSFTSLLFFFGKCPYIYIALPLITTIFATYYHKINKKTKESIEQICLGVLHILSWIGMFYIASRNINEGLPFPVYSILELMLLDSIIIMMIFCSSLGNYFPDIIEE